MESMNTYRDRVSKIIFGDCRKMKEVQNDSIQLMITSPPYFNSPFDYPGLFKDYDEFLGLMRDVAKELYRVLAPGRIACFVTQDVRVEGKLYPVPADIVRIMVEEGFSYRDRIIWRKPEGYIRISRRSGVQIQHPYPMYFYPDNIYEEILILQKGKYKYPKETNKLAESKIDLREFIKDKWYLSIWGITNVLPLKGRIEEGIAAFPEEIPSRLTKLFSYIGETVLDPFMGSGTTLKVATELGRRAVGYEIDLELLDVVKKKLKINETKLLEPNEPIEIIIRDDAKHLRTWLQERVRKQRSVVER
jgi:DNA modification methylase